MAILLRRKDFSLAVEIIQRRDQDVTRRRAGDSQQGI
jgi:hypothetical protein